MNSIDQKSYSFLCWLFFVMKQMNEKFTKVKSSWLKCELYFGVKNEFVRKGCVYIWQWFLVSFHLHSKAFKVNLTFSQGKNLKNHWKEKLGKNITTKGPVLYTIERQLTEPTLVPVGLGDNKTFCLMLHLEYLSKQLFEEMKIVFSPSFCLAKLGKFNKYVSKQIENTILDHP